MKTTREERCRLANQAAMHLKARPQFFIADNSLWLMWESDLTVVRKRKVRIVGSHFDWHYHQPWGGNQGAALVHLARWIRTGKMSLTVEYWERWCGDPVRLGNEEFLKAIKEHVYGCAPIPTPTAGEEKTAIAAILLRTIVAEAERTGSWTVPADLQERVKVWVAERDGGLRE